MAKTYKDSKYRNKGASMSYKGNKGKKMHKCKYKEHGMKNGKDE